MRIGNLAIDSKYTENIYIFRQFISTIVQHLSLSFSIIRLKRGMRIGISNKSRVNRSLFTFIEPSSIIPSGEISSATIKEQVDRVIFHRQSPTPLFPWIGHVDSIMQKYDNSPTPHRPGQINALSGPDPNAGSPLQLEDHNIFLRLLE